MVFDAGMPIGDQEEAWKTPRKVLVAAEFSHYENVF
jgi:hypothetical protein